MRVPNMSTDDNTTAAPNGASGGRSDQYSSRSQRQSFSSIHTPTPVSAGVDSSPQTTSDTNGIERMPSISPTYSQARQPINEAVTSAFQTTDSSMSPDLIQLITQNVIQQMQAHRLSASIPSSAQPVQPPTSHPGDINDTTSSFGSSPSLDRSHDYPPPSPHRSGSRVNAHGYETGIRREASPFHNISDEEAILSETDSKSTRPVPLRRISTDANATLLEKHWGKFFDESGKSTARLDVFLRGLAVHLIEDYEPRHSTVITPPKLLRFYEETKLTEQPDVYPWQLVFDDKTSQLSRLFRHPDIQIEHHLIQHSLTSRPEVPGMTPKGFATWMTLMIQAHPDQEFERLANTLRQMAIDNPDTKERFPKELPRSLFPTLSDIKLATTVSERMSKFCKVHVHARQSSVTESDATQPRSPPSAFRKTDPPAPSVEDVSDDSDYPGITPVQTYNSTSITDAFESPLRETTSRSSASAVPPEPSLIPDTSEIPTPRPIERERKPYVGQSGGGKSYDVASSSGDERQERVTSAARNSSIDPNDLRRTKSISSNPARSRHPPPIAIHQRGDVPDGPESARESARPRGSTVNADQGTSMYRTRSNSSYVSEMQPSRRRRSNSQYANDPGNTRYPSKRSPSMTKAGYETPRFSAPDVKNPTYQPPISYSSSYPQNPMPQQSYDYRSQNNDSRDTRMRERSRDREYDLRTSRPRMQSGSVPSGADAQNYPDGYYRSPNGYPSTNGGFVQPAGGPYQPPPTAYRDSRDPRDARDTRDSRDPRDNRDPRESRDNRDSRDSRV